MTDPNHLSDPEATQPRAAVGGKALEGAGVQAQPGNANPYEHLFDPATLQSDSAPAPLSLTDIAKLDRSLSRETARQAQLARIDAAGRKAAGKSPRPLDLY